MTKGVFQVLAFALMLGIPTWVIQRRRGCSLREAYALAFAHVLKWFGLVYAGLALLVTVVNGFYAWVLGRGTFPWWGVPMGLAMALVGYGVHRAGRVFVRMLTTPKPTERG